MLQSTAIAITLVGVVGARGAAAIDCTSKLVAVATGPDATCPSGARQHLYPVGGPAAACHGWTGWGGGREHVNSANNIRCNGDGSFSLVQFAGSLTCEGSGVEKTFWLGVCEQDRPPTLFSQGTDFGCCSSPNSGSCSVGIPSVTNAEAKIYLNGELCDDSGGGDGAALPDGVDDTGGAPNHPATSSKNDDGAIPDGEAGEAVEGSGRVTFTTYTDSSCTMLPTTGPTSTVELEVGAGCISAPKASISNVRCFADKIMYDNFPNQDDCSGTPISNELAVGVCTEFPGPVRTWKLIVADTYDCAGQSDDGPFVEGMGAAQYGGLLGGSDVNDLGHAQGKKQNGQGQRQMPDGEQQQPAGRGQGPQNLQGQVPSGKQQKQAGNSMQQRQQKRGKMLRGRPF